ncbi:MAG: hypothetical protein U0805_14735 [Pirellulales bacterium]
MGCVDGMDVIVGMHFFIHHRLRGRLVRWSTTGNNRQQTGSNQKKVAA